MTHGYSLRPNTKGRRKHQSIDKTDDQVEGTATSTSTSTTSTSERGHETPTDKLVEAESGTVDPRPITPDTPRAAAHNSPTQDSAKQDDWQQRHSRRSIFTSSAVITGATTATTTRYRVNGPPQTWEDIQAARKREEARRVVEAKRIRREQIVRGYEEEIRSLRARVVALRQECEVKVEKVRRKWERDWAIEQGEVAVVVEDGEEEGMLVGPDEEENWEDANLNSKMKTGDNDYVPTETSSVTTDNDNHQQWQWSFRSTPHWSRSESKSQPPPFQVTQKHLQSQRHQPHRDTGKSPLSTRDMMVVGPSRPLRRRLEPELLEATATATEEEEEDSDERGPLATEKTVTPSQGQGRKSHPQPLRRQPAQLMVFPTSSSSSSPSPSHGLHTYGTAVVDPVQIRFGGTDGDNDSEMDG